MPTTWITNRLNILIIFRNGVIVIIICYLYNNINKFDKKNHFFAPFFWPFFASSSSLSLSSASSFSFSNLSFSCLSSSSFASLSCSSYNRKISSSSALFYSSNSYYRSISNYFLDFTGSLVFNNEENNLFFITLGWTSSNFKGKILFMFIFNLFNVLASTSFILSNTSCIFSWIYSDVFYMYIQSFRFLQINF